MGKVIGLTGNMACGKSTVAAILRELGVPVVDADQVSREVTQAGSPTLKKVASAFGPSVLDAQGNLDRAALRKLAFGDDQSRKKLESILHPAIRARSLELFEQHFKAGAPVVVYEAALIVEAGRQTDFDGLLVVTCPEPMQTTRVRARDPGLSAEIAQQMISAQLPQAHKAKHATWIIENNSSLDELRRKVEDWFEQNVKAS